MKLWIRKLFVILITFMTLGLYIPPIYIQTDAESKEVNAIDENLNQDVTNTPISEDKFVDLSNMVVNEQSSISIDESDYFIGVLTDKAKEQTVSKLGPKIVSQIEADFMNDILPNMQHVIKMILADAELEQLPFYGITEQPTLGYGERIFNIYDYRTNQDVAKFHVRRDNRPMEGYWFNFHYHLSSDNFEEHHEIGEIYWDKNTPPKWLA